MERTGLLVVNEGPDGSGKETQTGLLCARLAQEGFRVRRYDFPTYGADPVADLIRTMLKANADEWNVRPWMSKAVLFASNRMRYRDELITALAEPGTVVVCNRYTPSNAVHMAGYVDDPGEQERRVQWVEHLEYDLMELPRPDLMILHTMPRAVSATLLEQREHGALDAHEADTDYLQRVELCFHALARRDSRRWMHVPADIDERVQPSVDVHERVWAAFAVHPVWQTFIRERVQAL